MRSATTSQSDFACSTCASCGRALPRVLLPFAEAWRQLRSARFPFPQDGPRLDFSSEPAIKSARGRTLRLDFFRARGELFFLFESFGAAPRLEFLDLGRAPPARVSQDVRSCLRPPSDAPGVVRPRSQSCHKRYGVPVRSYGVSQSPFAICRSAGALRPGRSIERRNSRWRRAVPAFRTSRPVHVRGAQRKRFNSGPGAGCFVCKLCMAAHVTAHQRSSADRSGPCAPAQPLPLRFLVYRYGFGAVSEIFPLPPIDRRSPQSVALAQARCCGGCGHRR